MDNKDYKITKELMDNLFKKYDSIILTIGANTNYKEEVIFYEGRYYKMWFDPIYTEIGGLEGSIYTVNPKNGFGINTLYRERVSSDEDVEKMFKFIYLTSEYNGRVYHRDVYKEAVDKYKNRTDLEIPHPGPKLNWLQKLKKFFKNKMNYE